MLIHTHLRSWKTAAMCLLLSSKWQDSFLAQKSRTCSEIGQWISSWVYDQCSSQSSCTSLKVKFSGRVDDSEQGFLTQSCTCWGEKIIISFCISLRWLSVRLKTYWYSSSLLSTISNGNISRFLFTPFFPPLQRFSFCLIPRILSLEVQTFSPRP